MNMFCFCVFTIVCK